MNPVVQLPREHARDLVEGDEVVELPSRHADLGDSEVGEDAASLRVACNAGRRRVPLVAVVFDGDFRLAPEQIGGEILLAGESFRPFIEFDDGIELGMGEPVPAEAIGKA